MLTYYQSHYEERWSALRGIASSHRHRTTYEDFITQVYSPAQLHNIYSSAASSNSGSRPASLLASSSLGEDEPLDCVVVPFV